MFSEAMTLGEKLAAGLGLTLLGMGVVFAVLAALSFGLDGLRVLLADKDKSAGAPVDTDAAPARVDTEPGEDFAVVIAAALAAFSEKSQDGLVVKSIRRAPPMEPAWGAIGRQNQMSKRL